MSATFTIGNSSYKYDEVDNFTTAIININDVFTGVQILLDVLNQRLKTLETGQREGFASPSDYGLYLTCQRQIDQVLARKVLPS